MSNGASGSIGRDPAERIDMACGVAGGPVDAEGAVEPCLELVERLRETLSAGATFLLKRNGCARAEEVAEAALQAVQRMVLEGSVRDEASVVAAYQAELTLAVEGEAGPGRAHGFLPDSESVELSATEVCALEALFPVERGGRNGSV